MKKTLLAVALAPLCLQSSLVSAQTTTDETMVVTANRFEQSTKNLIAPVSVVTKADIDAMQANSLTEVLRTLPGVQISTNGTYGHLGRTYVRGSDNVLFLLNGVRIGSATTGFTNVGQLPLTGIERIEFVRGNRAAVYGADATAGVINIITDSQPQQMSGEVKAEFGSEKYQQLTGSVANRLGERGWMKVAANFEQADGQDVASFGSNDDDGFRNRDGLIDAGIHLNDHWTLAGNAYYHEGNIEFDDSFGGSEETDNLLYNVSGRLVYDNDQFSSELILAMNRDEAENADPSVTGSKIVTDRNVISWRNAALVQAQTWLGAGLEYTDEQVKDSNLWDSWNQVFNSYDKGDRDNKAAYVTVNHDGQQAQAEASVRVDDNEQYGTEFTWQLGAGWRFSDALRLTGNAGTGFRAPTFNDLYWPNFGNPTLEPEESKTVEVAFDGQLNAVYWRLAAYQNDIDNRITCQSGSCQNDDALIKGIELVAAFETGAFDHHLSLEYLDPKDKNLNQPLSRVAKQNAKWNIVYNAADWQASLNYLYQGERQENLYGGGVYEMGGYSLFDVAASYYLTEQVTLSGRVANLFDKEYELVQNYNTQERSYYASVTYQF
ncbi:TonB-dependent receptor domain-containing protein [Photobacterium sp. TLY01]|uniref:TonB-dependent receptor domain-containing protein n=1 Tax=Photobacterium sp. TLY01 TaxID=2907534 RepID=UPI001F3FEEDF|nr:TonB-dependent receptor [Photobacterium sp. TLY01]UIP27817.1 TonB-dependent receptor [Photobacterium sp. TLY01]